MKKETEQKTCVFCNSPNTVRNGTQRGKQRYKCKDCNRTFCEDSNGIAYERNTQKALALLYYLLKNNFFYKTDIRNAWNALYKHKNRMKRNNFSVEIINHITKTDNIECYNAKTIICLEDDKIIFHQLEDSGKQTVIIKDYEYNKGKH